MKRYVIRIAILAGVVIVCGIAIAQAQRNPEGVTVLPPSPTDRTEETYQPPSGMEARGQENPLRDGRPDPSMRPVTDATPASSTASGTSYAPDLFHANPIPATSPNGQDPIRMTNYGGTPESGSPELTPASRGEEPLPLNATGTPAMTPLQPGLANAVERDSFPTAEQMNRMPDPADQTGYKPYTPDHAGDQPYSERPTNGYTQPNNDQPNNGYAQPTNGYAQPSNPGRDYVASPRYPDPADTTVIPAAPAAVPAAPEDLRATPTDNHYTPGAPVGYDSHQPLSREPDRLTPAAGEQPLPPVNEPSRYEPPGSSYAPFDPNRTNPSANHDPGTGYGRVDSTVPASSRPYEATSAAPGDRLYSPNVTHEENHIPPRIQPEGAAAIESQGPTGVGQPSRNRSWEGEQLPQLRVVKVAPKEIQVGKPTIFRVEIENVGRVTAQGVEVRDQIPQSTRLISTKPESVTDSQGGLVWQLGEMKPGEKASVEMKLMPTAEGDNIGSVATVRFGTSASVRTVATRPMLNVEVVAEDHVMVQSDTTLTIRISNPGSGVATGVALIERIPQGLQHPGGAELQYEVGNLAPKASKTIQLKLSAVRPGMAKNVLIAKADGLTEVVRESNIDVVAPELQIAMKGPEKRYLNRKVSYEVAVSNPGSAAAKDVRLVATLPPGLKFVEANNNGHYDPNSRTVRWALAELPVHETGTVRLTALPVEMGDHAVKVQGTADRAIAVKKEQTIKVDGIAALRFEVVDVKDPVEVGFETAYEIRVLNQGTKDASNVAVQVALPPGFEVVAAEGPGSLRSTQQDGKIIFEPIQRLAPKVDTTFRVRVRCRQAGDYRLRVELNSDDLKAPVVKEESTKVFGDK